MKRRPQLTGPQEEERHTFGELQHRLAQNKSPDDMDVSLYRRMALANPGLISHLMNTSESLRSKMLGNITDGHGKAHILTEEDTIKLELGYKMATPLERLLIEQILTARIHVLHAENVFSEKVAESVTFAAGTYWQNFLASAQRRYLRAIETLARVRRLARNGPLFQVNIATAGGKQINTQGELFDFKGHPSMVRSERRSSEPAFPKSPEFDK